MSPALSSGRSPAPRRDGRRERGFALVLVLWSLVLLAFIGTRLSAAARSEAQIARNLVGAAMLEAAADGAAHEAIFRLVDRSPARWRADGVRHQGAVGEIATETVIESPAGRINPNTAPAALLAALAVEAGADPRRAPAIGAAIFDWRSPGMLASPGGAKAPQYRAAGLDWAPTGQPFARLDELGAVLGVGPELAAALAPHLSLWNTGAVDPEKADPAVRRALAAAGAGQPEADASSGEIVLVTALAARADGMRFVRRATVLLAAERAPDGDRPYRILAWESGGD